MVFLMCKIPRSSLGCPPDQPLRTAVQRDLLHPLRAARYLCPDRCTPPVNRAAGHGISCKDFPAGRAGGEV